MKLIKIVEAYPDKYMSIVSTLSAKIVQLFASCNSDTIYAPIESLTILSMADQSVAVEMGKAVLPSIMELFSTYHQDAMLSNDILALIKVLGNVEDTSTFRATVLPVVT